MSVISSCIPANCVPFADPSNDAEKSLRLMAERALVEKTRPLNPTDDECREVVLSRFLRRNQYEMEGAMANWTRWVKWRHDVGADAITKEAVKYEIESGIASWRGKDKKGRPCCVITGRMHDPRTRLFNHKSFQKFLIRLVEEGMRLADESGQDEVCVLYDRRGLEFKHIDPILHQFTKRTIDVLKEWYGDSLTAIYVLHLNWYYSLFYSVLLKPLLSTLASDKVQLMVAADVPELFEHFHEEDIFLLSTEYNADTGLAHVGHDAPAEGAGSTTAIVGSVGEVDVTLAVSQTSRNGNSSSSANAGGSYMVGRGGEDEKEVEKEEGKEGETRRNALTAASASTSSSAEEPNAVAVTAEEKIPEPDQCPSVSVSESTWLGWFSGPK